MSDYLPLTDQLQILFETVRHTEDRPFTLQEVSNGTGISLGTISQMRTGKITNPQLNTLRAMCDFFGIPLRYFETRTREECYALLSASPPTDAPTMHEIAFRALHLSEDAQRDILTMIKWVQAAEAQHRQDGTLPTIPHLKPYDDR